MKKYTQKLILLIVAATMLFTGSGVTVVNLNCVSCSEQTLVIPQIHKCCAQSSCDEGRCCLIPGHKSHHKNECENSAHINTPSCTSSRLAIDIGGSVSYRSQISIPFVWISDSYSSLTTKILLDSEPVTKKITYFKLPPGILPREYLSFIRVLII